MSQVSTDPGLDFTLIVPCLNEEGHLEESVDEIREILAACPYSWEILFVDDGSTDRTRNIIRNIASTNPKQMRFHFNERNLGRGATVTRGAHMALGRWAGFVDIDLEVGAHYIPYCLHDLARGADLVTGWRIYKLRFSSFWRHVASRGYSALVTALLGLPYHDTETGFKFFNRATVLPTLDKIENARWFWDTEIMALAWIEGLRVVEKPCLFIRKPEKKSTVNLIPDSFRYFVDLCRFRFVTWPRLQRQRPKGDHQGTTGSP